MNNFELIRLIKERRPLWDRTCWEQVDSRGREAIWDELAEILGFHKRILKARWKNLRDSYRKIVKNHEAYETSEAKWSYYNAMEFMKDISLKATPRNIDITRKEHVPIEPDYTFTLESNSNPEDTIFRERPIKIEAGIKRRASEDLVNEFLEISGETKPEREDVPHNLERDDDYQFLQSLLPHLKMVPQFKKLPLRMKIEQLIYEEICAAQNQKENDCGCIKKK